MVAGINLEGQLAVAPLSEMGRLLQGTCVDENVFFPYSISPYYPAFL